MTLILAVFLIILQRNGFHNHAVMHACIMSEDLLHLLLLNVENQTIKNIKYVKKKNKKKGLLI